MKNKEMIQSTNMSILSEQITLDDNELIGIKGGFKIPGSGSNCDCGCSDPIVQPGSGGENCHCNCSE